MQVLITSYNGNWKARAGSEAVQPSFKALLLGILEKAGVASSSHSPLVANQSFPASFRGVFFFFW